MIIKSMSRKAPSFSQLMDYMESGRSDNCYTIHHNLFSRDPEEVKKEFEENSQLLQRRAGANYLYHEVVSITRTDQIELKEQKEKLREIVSEYIQQRARNNMAYAALHDDKKENLHYHVIISANEVGSKTRHRLSKYQFGQIKKSLETRVLEHYPELNQKKLINHTATEKLSNKGAELKRRTGKTPQREAVQEKVRKVFSTARTREQLLKSFDKAGLDFYMRGNTPGVIDRATGRKHRIKTLGFINEFNAVNKVISDDLKQQKTKKQAHKNRKSKYSASKKPRLNIHISAVDTPACKQAFREWILGDFSARDTKAKKEAYEQFSKILRDKDPKLSTKDKINEWISGDFSARESISRAERIKTFYSKLQEENREYRAKKQQESAKQQTENNKQQSSAKASKNKESTDQQKSESSQSSQHSSSSSQRGRS